MDLARGYRAVYVPVILLGLGYYLLLILAAIGMSLLFRLLNKILDKFLPPNEHP